MSIEAMKQARNAFVWNLNTDLDNIPACDAWAKMLRKNIDALDQAIQEEALRNVQRLGQEIEPCPYVVSTREGTHHCALSHREPLTFEQVEDCFPDGCVTNEHGEIVVSAQWLHDFAVAVQRAANGIK